MAPDDAEMESVEPVRNMLIQIADLLEAGREIDLAMRIRSALSGSDKAVEAFLVSNGLWGGAESIADSAFLTDKSWFQQFALLMIKLGKLQTKRGKVNPRTRLWLDGFESSVG